MNNTLMSVTETANYLNVGKSTVYSVIKKEIPYYEIGGIKFMKSDLDKWIATKRVDFIKNSAHNK